jgi:hypothetical protein
MRQIDAATGPLVLTKPDGQTVTLEGGETVNFDPPLAGILAYAPDGSRFHVVYETDPPDTEASRSQVGEKPKRTERKRSAPSKASRGDRHRRASSAAKSSGSKSSGSKSKAKSGSKSSTSKRSSRKKG